MRTNEGAEMRGRLRRFPTIFLGTIKYQTTYDQRSRTRPVVVVLDDIANLCCRSLVPENTKSSRLKRLTKQKLVEFDVGKILRSCPLSPSMLLEGKMESLHNVARGVFSEYTPALEFLECSIGFKMWTFFRDEEPERTIRWMCALRVYILHTLL